MIRKFVHDNWLQPADVILVEKTGWRILDHYVVFLGEKYGHMYFAANLIGKGVTVMSEDDLSAYSNRFAPISVKRFAGDEQDRYVAVQRALSLKGKKYSLLNFNCEHYANYVQHARAESPQVGNWIGGLSLVALFGLLLNSRAA